MQVGLGQAVGGVTGLSGFELRRLMRTGTVASVDNRNWEISGAAIIRLLSQSRAIALDMESAAIAANGSAYRVAQLVAHNAAFDGPFLQAWYEKHGVYLPARRQVLCTLQRAIWFFVERPEESCPRDFKLATLCQHFRVPFHAADAHEALADVSATLNLYKAIRFQESKPPIMRETSGSKNYFSRNDAHATGVPHAAAGRIGESQTRLMESDEEASVG